MVGYLAILGAALAGYAGLGLWAIGAAGIALASISQFDHAHAHGRGRELSLHGIIDTVVVRSMLNGVIASGSAYGFGWLMRAI